MNEQNPPGDHKRSKIIPPAQRSFVQFLKDIFSIRYHVHRLKEDLTFTKAALAKRKLLLAGTATAAELPEIFRGKLMGVFFATGWTNLIGIALGGFLQFRFGNPLLGLYSTPPLCFLITGIAFQIGWWADNKTIYGNHNQDPYHQFLNLQKDMWPMHRAALPIAIGFSLLNYILITPLYGLLSAINPMLAKNTPAGALIMLVEFLFIGSTFVRLMGDFFDRHSYTLAAKYKEICAKTSAH
jgi:hypothetical protein